MVDLPLQVLVNNAALLLAVAVIFDAASLGLAVDRTPLHRAILGLLLGVIGISIMLTPWQFAPGIFFDTRTVLLNSWGCSSGRSRPCAPLR